MYGVYLSGNSQKAILGCALMHIPYEVIVVDNLIGPDAEHGGLRGAKSEEFKKLNPRGLVPVIVDHDKVNGKMHENIHRLNNTFKIWHINDCV